MIICPKCQYQRQACDVRVIEGTCPRCGIAYAKWKPTQPRNKKRRERNNPEPEFTIEPYLSTWQRVRLAFLYIPNKVDSITFWARVILATLFGLWGASFIYGGIDWEGIGGSFLHNVNLPFHEFGHVLFSPFGRFMMFLGGSLFQVILPLGIMLGFTFKQRDNFAASIMLWWCGQNLIDISPYIYDAPYRALPLILGLGEESHDWGNILTMTNSLDSAASLARCSFLLGSFFIITALIWASYLLKQMHKNISDD